MKTGRVEVPRFATAFAVAAAVGWPIAGHTQELTWGLGAARYDLDEVKTVAVGSLEYSMAPFGRLLGGEATVVMAVEPDSGGSVWAGAGLGLRWMVYDQWFTEAAVMPGYNHAGGADADLGGPVIFRSHIAIGRWLTETTAMSVAAVHKSNADLYDQNPGVNTLLLRLHHDF